MNKNNMKHLYKLATLALLGSVMGLYTQCAPEKAKIDAHEGTTYKAPIAAPKSQGEFLLNLEVSEGVKNYEEILMTYEAVTGIPATNQQVSATYRDVMVSLPTDNEMKSYLSGHQVAAARLAAVFCDEMYKSGGPTGVRQNIWSEANYGRSPAANAAADDAFTSGRREELITKIMTNFWGPTASDAEKIQLKVVLNKLISDLLEGEPNNTETTGIVVKGVCTAALSSMHVISK